MNRCMPFAVGMFLVALLSGTARADLESAGAAFESGDFARARQQLVEAVEYDAELEDVGHADLRTGSALMLRQAQHEDDCKVRTSS